MADGKTFQEKLRALLDEDEEAAGSTKKDRDDEDDMIVIRGKAARRFLGIDDEPAGTKGDEDGTGDEDGKGDDDAPRRGKGYFKA